ncbi:MAG: DUF1638 domain-containing protein [Granulosicoccus sp.]
MSIDQENINSSTLVIACGAIAHELVSVLKANQWRHMDVQCLPAKWHNTPDLIAPGVEEKIIKYKHQIDRILVAYGDCGTGGHLDAVIERHRDDVSIERLPGNHCYDFYAGLKRFEALSDDELGTFYLTDYLAANFERLILDNFGIRKHLELREMIFANYTRVLYLAQRDDPALMQKANAAAAALDLPLEIEFTGLKPFNQYMKYINIKAA